MTTLCAFFLAEIGDKTQIATIGCWVLHKPIEKSSAWGQKTPYYNRPTQDGLRGHFVLRAIGKRFRKDRTAGCEKVVGIRFALDSSLEGWREMDSNFRFREDGSSFFGTIPIHRAASGNAGPSFRRCQVTEA